MTIRPCAEGNDLAEYGADCSGCMNDKILFFGSIGVI